LLIVVCTFSFGHCVVCSSSIYGFWLLLWYLVAIVLYVLLLYRFWLLLWYLVAIVLYVLLLYTDSDCSFGHNGYKIPKEQSESVYRRRTYNTMATRYQRSNQNQYIEEHTTQWHLSSPPVLSGVRVTRSLIV
jgi:ABC-type bacteriocin/lantibiotic exporter with double-glycine peptidase domain